MKKVIFLFFLFITINVYAEERTYIDQHYLDVYYNGFTNGTFVSNRFVFKEHGGIPIYCLSFNIPISTENGYGIYELKNVDIYTQDQKKYIEAISYFGYKYKDHDDINYYYATQELIWSHFGNDVYWTYTKNGSDYIDITQYKTDILNLYNEYMIEDQVVKEYYSLEVGNSYYYEDYNTYLEPYIYSYYGPNQLKNDSYGVTFKAYTKGQDSLILTRMFDKGFESLLFMQEGYQTILKGGRINSRNRFLYFDIKNTSLKLMRTNIDEPFNRTLKNMSLKLDGAVYNIYDLKYNYLTSVTTDENGEAIVYDLPLGTLRIKEETSSYGFEPNEYYTDTSILFGNTPSKETLYVVPIKKELNITNIYKIDNVEYLDPGIKFEIYRDNVLINTFETDTNGKINSWLEYGKYTIKQLNAREGFDIEPEFEFEVNKLENNLNYIFIKEKNTTIENNIDEVTINEQTLEEDNIIDDTALVIETKTTNLVFETDNNKLLIDNLPKLYETKDIFDILCENLLLYFC